MSITDQLELPVGIDLPPTVKLALDDRLLQIARRLAALSQASTAAAATMTGTRAQRLLLAPQEQVAGTQWIETDTDLSYVIRSSVDGGKGLVWWYLAGTQRGNYSVFSGLVLTKFDANLLFHITDKNRTMRWTGTGWTFADHEVIPPGYITGFASDPGTGWQICDGSAIETLNSDGTQTAGFAADFTTARYPKWGPTADGAGAAVAPLITGSTASATTGITVSAAAAASAATGQVAAGADTDVLVPPLDGGGGGGAVTDPGHVHAHGTLVNDALGEPPHYGLAAFQRL